MELLDSPFVIVAMVFLARVVDVTLGTVRTILVFRGHKYWAALIGFVEILVWIVAVSRVIQNLDDWYLAVAYAGGFAAGNIVGIWVEGKLAIGSELVRVVSENADVHLSEKLRSAGFHVIEIPARSKGHAVEILLVVERRRRIPQLLHSIDACDPEAYYTVSDVKDQAAHYRRGTRRRTDPSPFTPTKKK